MTAGDVFTSDKIIKNKEGLRFRNFTRFNKFVKADSKRHGNKTVSEYAISLNMAKEYEFVEDEDYTTFTKIGERKKGQRGAAVSIQYAISINMAKQLGMLENNEGVYGLPTFV